MPKLKENLPLASVSRYKIGGPARFFFAPKNEREVLWAVREARARKVPIFILGGGTNLLIHDRGFAGLVIRPDLSLLKSKGETISVGSGVSMDDLMQLSIKKSLSGLEWAGGLPGTVGGAIRGNAGCFGGEMKDVIVSVRSFDLAKMKIVERTARECRFGYRDSIFKKKAAGEIILSATLRMKKGNAKAIKKAIAEKVDHRKKNHPLEYPNIGSIFKNVPLTAIHKEKSPEYKKALRESTIVFRGSSFSVKTDPFPVISTAKLISESGIRGVSSGGAMISTKHPNFIVNVLDARSVDVQNLIILAKAEVKRKFGVTLEEEVQIL